MLIFCKLLSRKLSSYYYDSNPLMNFSKSKLLSAEYNENKLDPLFQARSLTAIRASDFRPRSLRLFHLFIQVRMKSIKCDAINCQTCFNDHLLTTISLNPSQPKRLLILNEEPLINYHLCNNDRFYSPRGGRCAQVWLYLIGILLYFRVLMLSKCR